MKIILKSICFLAFLLIAAQSDDSFIEDPFDDYSQIDISGDWYSSEPNSGSAYFMHIDQDNGKYTAYYCFETKNGVVKDCNNSENMIIEIDNHRLTVSMFSELGGLVQGNLYAVGPRRLKWQTNVKMGENITPSEMIFTRKGEPMYRNFTLGKVKIDSIMSGDELVNENGLALDKTKLKLNVNPEADSTVVSEVDKKMINGAVFLVTEYFNNQAQNYLVSVDKEKNEISRIGITHDEKQISAIYKKVPTVEVNEDLDVIITKKLYKKQNLVYEKKEVYKLNPRGRFKLQYDGINPRMLDYKSQKYLAYLN